MANKLLFFYILLSSVLSRAELLETSYVQLSTPSNWSCEFKTNFWLCRSTDKNESREAFIAVKAKLSNNKDNLENYLELLNKPKTYIDNNKRVGLSKVYSCSKTNIDNFEWVQALHFESEAKNYFTKYFLTTRGDLSLAIELTYHKSKYEKYSQLIEQLSKTIKLKDNMASTAKRVLLPPASTVFPTVNPQLDAIEAVHADQRTKKNVYFLAGFAILIFLGLLTYWKYS